MKRYVSFILPAAAKEGPLNRLDALQVVVSAQKYLYKKKGIDEKDRGRDD